MTRPTPEQWWSDLTGGDRVQFMNEVVPDGRVSLDMWMKLRRAGIISAGHGYGDHNWDSYLTGSHLRYVLSKAAERNA